MRIGDAEGVARSPIGRVGPSADAQVFGCHHPNIATKRHAAKILIWMPICIQYWTGAASL